MEKNHETIMK